MGGRGVAWGVGLGVDAGLEGWEEGVKGEGGKVGRFGLWVCGV